MYLAKFLSVLGSALLIINIGTASPFQSSNTDDMDDSTSVVLSSNPGESDFPSICSASQKERIAVWQAYQKGKKKDYLYISQFKEDKWSKPEQVPDIEGDLFRPVCGTYSDKQTVIVWMEQRGDEWDLWRIFFDGNNWSEPNRLFQRKGNDLYPVIANNSEGDLALVWQGWNGDNYDIFMSEFNGRKWSRPELVTSDPSNDWLPDLVVAENGVRYVSWDSYRNGNYDIFLRKKNHNEWEEEVLIAGSPKFEANSNLAVDKQHRAWITYEERDESWGEDRGYVISPGFNERNSLLGYSRARVKCYHQGRLLRPLIQPPPKPLEHQEWGGDRAPEILFDSQGKLWLFVRRPTVDWKPFGSFGRKIPFAYWKNYGLYFDGRFWSEPIEFDKVPSRLDSKIDVVSLPNGGFQTVWFADNRHDKWYAVPDQNRIYTKKLPKINHKLRSFRLTPDDPNYPGMPDQAAIKRQNKVKRVRNYSTTIGEKNYKIYRGDLHRHTNISWDGPSEGTIIDMFRYTYDVGALDFVAITDHNQLSGTDLEYVWWRTQKMSDIFHSPPHFITLLGYERSITYPYGHRNVIHSKRGIRPFPRPKGYPEQRDSLKNDTHRLYHYLRKTNGIAIPHTSAISHGTDWHHHTFHDPSVEPVVEIYQGTRTSYEHEGAPRADLPNDTGGDQLGGYQPKGFVWNAWKKGMKIGVIASSDHISTHISYANILAKVPSRDGLLNAMKKRHTYGSTDNIVLNFTINEYLQGDVLQTSSFPQFSIDIEGTSPIEKLVIFKNFEKVKIVKNQSEEIHITWQDKSPEIGENHYYLRVEQSDGELAWSSPIWVDYKGNPND